MSESVIEHRVSCPFCAEPMSILVDISAGDQSYIEDCQICCQPMQVSFQSDGDNLIAVRVDCAS